MPKLVGFLTQQDVRQTSVSGLCRAHNRRKDDSPYKSRNPHIVYFTEGNMLWIPTQIQLLLHSHDI